jgi:small conductance mechanosensitive channel
MNKSKKRKLITTIIFAVIAVILIISLLNPQWLFDPTSASAIKELELEHMLIKRSEKLTFAHFATVLLAICIVWLVYMALKLILKLIGKKSDRTKTVTSLIAGVLKYVAVIAAVVWALSILGVNTAAVLAGVGILGLILGFGAQSLIEDIITGIFIIFEGQYNIGDIIILDDFRGTVRDIGVRTTVIEDAGGNLKVVNNSDIRNFQNRSKNPSVAICEVAVAYETDLLKLRELLEAELPKMLDKHPDLYLAAPKYLGVDALADSGVNLKIAVSCTEANVFAARRMLTQDVRVLFMEKGVEIPFPQVVVHKGED